MATTEEQQAQALAYVYDELEGDAKAAFEAQLSSDRDLSAEVEGLRATRTLLDADMMYGERSGLDDPPSHLYESILRAEALSRPPELKAAVAAAIPVRGEAASAGGFSDLTKKLAAWVLGGGIAVGGVTAALLFVVAGDEASPAAAEVAMNDIVAPAASAKDNEGAEEQKASAQPTEKKREQSAKAKGVAEEPEADREQQQRGARGALGDEASDYDGLAQNAHGRNFPGNAPPPQDKAAKPQTAAAPQRMPAPSKTSGRYTRDDLDPPAVVTGESAPAASQSVRIANMADAMGADRGRQMEPLAEPALEEAASEDDEDAKGGAFGRGSNASSGGVFLGAGGASDRSEQGAVDATRSTSEKERPAAKRDAKKQSGSKVAAAPKAARTKRKRASKKSVPSGPQKLSKDESSFFSGSMSSSKRRKAKKKNRRPTPEQVAVNSRADMDAEITLASASRQLAQHNYREADRLFEEAGRLDRTRRRLGVLPVAGRVRALSALGQHQMALRVFATVEKKGVKTPGASDAYLAAAASAEAIGDLGRAQSLYRQLLKVKTTKQTAKNGLARVQRRRARMDAAEQASADSAAADEPAEAEATKD